VVLTLLVRLLGPFIAKGPPQSQATTPITATTQPPGRPSGNSLDVGLPAHETTPVRPRTPGPATRTPDGAQAAVVRRNTACTVDVGAAGVLAAAAGRSVADGASWELERLNIELTTTAVVSTMATAARIHSAT